MTYESLHDRLKGKIAKNVAKKLGIKNVNAVPTIEKVVISTGINKSKMDGKEMKKYVIESLTKISGQQPVTTKAKKAISNFKTREGMVIGAMVTLRGKQMENFLDRFLSYGLPRVRDFRGASNKLDGHGNYSIGIKDHSIFPEIDPPDAKQIFGLQIQITTTAKTDEEGRALLEELGVPFRKRQQDVKKEKDDNSIDDKDDSTHTS
ncbi:50S ribosomal protein L5 [Candidatus Peregrinibacteria bacterium]|mgnify:FL=1|jgi:large subunit ribosomal protein L5|nr:50S ribosomal protein L5 [Candidatus Peregrinibacteria bacterium]MBT3599081.1 50S ribosomal protein L5 [Candidatus Peregrinibacteria bacterium]MBT4367684.1 50S ribosomal protein L5 [Candidatus Peregrinibacteria bacterium]MBT4585630.1 50S ribosomal protein L5 [Candidatus Peregrinibacteria bacterium]MBT6730387.1 50S ribosomal protein L5 [Candidatus Peregrinibacteria bacterium]